MPFQAHVDPILTVHVELENPTPYPQVVMLEKGRCFEIMDPSNRLQNAALAKDVQVEVPPYQCIEVEVPAFCLNKYRNMYGEQAATVTPFLLSHRSNDQLEVWKKIEYPAA